MADITSVETWWYILCAISVFNLAAWVISYRLLIRSRARYSEKIFSGRITMIWLSFVYVIVCAFRSFFPRIDLERISLVDHWLSNVLLGRTVTTVAEICFIAQCALLLREAGTGKENNYVVFLSLLLIPIVVIAEGFSWYASITTVYLASVIEESLWTVCGLLLVTSFISLWSDADKTERSVLSAIILFGTGFIAFMVFVDVPMYWARYVIDTESGKTYMSFWQGLQDLARSYRVSYDWTVWRDEVPWMTLYFTVAVWVSIGLPHIMVFSKKSRL